MGVAREVAYRLILAYDGSAYAGWQRQPNGVAVQQVVEEAIAAIAGEAVRIVGAGRTDAGVHALGQVVSFRLARRLPLEALVFGCNAELPRDVRVVAAGRGPDDFHALRHAVAKDYRYTLSPRWVEDPLLARRALRVDPELDWEAMAAAMACLDGRHDFSAFALAGGSHRSAVRRVFAARLDRSVDEIVLRFVGEGFLRGMVRSLTGTLLEVGRERRSVESFAALLRGGGRGLAGPTAPAHGLTLAQVLYPRCWWPLDLVDRPRRAALGRPSRIR